LESGVALSDNKFERNIGWRNWMSRFRNPQPEQSSDSTDVSSSETITDLNDDPKFVEIEEETTAEEPNYSNDDEDTSETELEPVSSEVSTDSTDALTEFPTATREKEKAFTTEAPENKTRGYQVLFKNGDVVLKSESVLTDPSVMAENATMNATAATTNTTVEVDENRVVYGVGLKPDQDCDHRVRLEFF
jgi:hypothetical protein